MSEHCHCTHAVQKRACQHKGFCERIKELEDANKDKSQLLAAFRKDIEELEAGIATLWEVNESSDDLNEFRDLLCDLTGKERQ